MLAWAFVVAVAIGLLCAPGSARATTYEKTSTITPGGKYLLVSNISNNPANPVHAPAPTVLGSVLMNGSLIGTQAFSLSGNFLAPSGSLTSWEFTMLPSGTSDGGNPGYLLQQGGMFLDMGQDVTGVFSAQTPPIMLGTTPVAYRDYVSEPFSYLSAIPRVWFWDGARFYTKYTSDTTSIGRFVADPLWPEYYVSDATYGWARVEWNTPWGAYGANPDGTSQYGAKYTGIKFYLAGVRPGGDPVFPPGIFPPTDPMSQVRGFQYYFGGRWAVGVSPVRGAFESPGPSDLYPSALEVKNISLYQVFVDTTPPTINGLPADKVAEATSSSGAVVTWTAPTATDLVDGAVAPVCTPRSGSTFPLGITTVSVTATDAAGNAAVRQFTVTVSDTTGPAISGYADMVAEATGSGGAAVTWSAPTATDLVDGAVATVCTPLSGSTFPLGVTTVDVTAVDSRGNTTTKQFTVTVSDTTGPVISGMPVDQVVEATGMSGAAVSWTDPTASDLLDGPVATVCTPTSGSTFPVGVTIVDVTAVDSRGNTSTKQFNVTVVDTTAPVINGVPADQGAEATGMSGAVVSWTDPTATDLVDGAVTPVCTPPSGSTFPLGVTTVDIKATDGAGNSSNQQFTVTVYDTTGPVISGVPADQVAEATGPGGAVVSWTDPTATDLVDQTATLVCTPASGSTFPLGVTTVGIKATDAAGNTSTQQFTVTVSDTTAPVISGVPADQAAEATGPGGAAVSWAAPSATDVADSGVTAVCSPASGSTFPVGVTTVHVKATDASGNTSTKQFTVTVSDTTGPVIIPPKPPVVEASGPAGAVVTWSAPTATDLVSGRVTPVCSPPSGSKFPVGVTKVTIKATDAAGNTSTKQFTVTVSDTTGPVITPPKSPVVEASGPAGAVVTWPSISAIDPVSGSVTSMCSPASGSTFAIGATVVTITATDTAGNSSSKQFTVTVTHKAGPTITAPSDLVVVATGPAGAAVTWLAPSARDLVSGAVIPRCSSVSGSTYPIGATVVTVTATDTAGNVSTRQFQVVVAPRGIAKIGTVRFLFNQAQLTPTAKSQLRSLARSIKAHGYTYVSLQGFTSGQAGYGTWANRKRLSLNRAKNTRAYLLAQLSTMSPTPTTVVIGYGPAKPVATNLTSAGRAKNRRVEIWAK